MRGLMLKDYYSIIKNCRMYFIIVVVFTLSALFGNNNLFFMFYPAFIVGIIPSTLIAYDEHDRWNEYRKTLPYSDTAFVASKYAISMILAAFTGVFTAIANAVKMAATESFSASMILSCAMIVIAVALISSAINLPFVLRFGAAKGRIVSIAVTCAALGIISFINIPSDKGGVGVNIASIIQKIPFSVILLIAAIAAFALSFAVALALYKTKKE